MGIYVRGAKKPKKCFTCNFAEARLCGDFCTRLNRFVGSCLKDGVPDDCPIVEVSDDCGRLIAEKEVGRIIDEARVLDEKSREYVHIALMAADTVVDTTVEKGETA